MDCDWFVGATLGGTKGLGLLNYQSSPLPPIDDWYYWSEDGEWTNNDPSLTLEFTSLSPCQLVRVAGKGGVVKKQSSSLGDYRSAYDNYNHLQIHRFTQK